MKKLLLLCLLSATPAFAQGVLLERGLDGASPHLKAVWERVRIRIDHQNAQTVLEQEFENLSDQQLEGRYVLRTASAIVEGFAYWNGEQKIVGEVFEKHSARTLYQSVIGKSRDPGLLEHTGEGSFAFNVFPIQPRERKRIEVRLGQRLARVGPRLEYRLTLAGGESEVVAEIADDHPLSRIDSQSHALEVERPDPRRARLRAYAKPSGARDLVLEIEVSADPWQPSVVLHRDPGQDPYLVLQMAAPAQVEQGNVSAKDVTLVIDRSGSMSGPPMEEACAAAELVVRRLRRGDRVNVIAFDDGVDPLFAKPRPIEAAREPALQFIRRIRAGGGTNIAPDYNLQLSKRRARAVRAYLVKAGVASLRLQSDGFGSARPIDSNETAEGRARNRRVEMGDRAARRGERRGHGSRMILLETQARSTASGD